MANRYFEDKEHAERYQKFRPQPPQKLIDFIVNYAREKTSVTPTLAVDVGCGSGQATFRLAQHFDLVKGFDVSPNQVEEANKSNACSNVEFAVSPAETLDLLEDGTVQLMTCCAAIHWLDIPKFFSEAHRVLCPRGALAAFCYFTPELHFPANPTKNAELNSVFDEFALRGELSKYYPPQSQMVKTKYRDISFPSSFTDTIRDEDSFGETVERTLELVCFQITTWSLYELYKRDQGSEAADALLQGLLQTLANVIKDEVEPGVAPEQARIDVTWKYFILLGRKA